MAERVSVTRRIPASAAAVFAVVSDPAGHVRIDGSGMLVAAPDAAPPTAVGDTFEMDMDRTPLGDLPGVTAYRTLNTVTAYEPGRRFEWSVTVPGRPPIGYVWGYLVEPAGEGASDVTSYFDWSGLSAERKARSAGRLPLIPETTIAATLERLERVVVAG
ncbi:SRPBCC family protein [Trujillonella endophytica]|uniref:Polyketide cyclase / dehydrase and lipid transport n=1 Tax=Trujillonella endophytica TaxID=673521 RepID=A0A1H8R235_9ACTN|nr:SRPBCC family protein [Trujillella endophytica]SEO60341.1 Polyketide cyclase / dehydrase and lipid transport [Trujillella endophytica]